MNARLVAVTSPGPFASSASELTAKGLVVIPVGGEDGKKPLVRWRQRQRPLGAATLDTMCRKFGTANVGLITGASGVTVVDCDAPDAVDVMLQRCGETPLRTRTPSGGVHLWYAGNGEPCANLRSQGLEVDIKGVGGYVVIPPSIRPTGPAAGRQYELLMGSWSDLPKLPRVMAGSLAVPGGRLDAVMEGARNDTLFKRLLRDAPWCDDLADLMDCAETINGCYPVPLSPAEVAKTAKSVWKIQMDGNNWLGGPAAAQVRMHEFDAVVGQPHGADAIAFLIRLRLSHLRNAEFAISAKAMKRAQVMSGWGVQRYRNAVGSLLRAGALLLTHKGGQHDGDVSRYRFGVTLPALDTIQ